VWVPPFDPVAKGERCATHHVSAAAPRARARGRAHHRIRLSGRTAGRARQLADGIVIYEHAGFGGGSAHLTSDADDLSATRPLRALQFGRAGYSSSYTYDWNDCISSIKVAPGWRATVFVDFGFHEDCST